MVKVKKYIILFDGTCNLCNSSVNFIKKHIRRGQFHFIPLESEKASEFIIRFKKRGLNKGSMTGFYEQDCIIREKDLADHSTRN